MIAGWPELPAAVVLDKSACGGMLIVTRIIHWYLQQAQKQ